MLKPTVYAALVDEHLVLLNVAADAYSCLPRGDLELGDDGMTLACRDPGIVGDLLAAGLAEQAPGVREPRRRSPAARRSALRTHYPPPGATELRDGAVALLDLLRRYRGRSFAQILETVRQRPAAPRANGPQDPFELVDRFHGWVPYAPISGKCLLRSFLLLRLLHRYGHDAIWVFGVTTWPFEAHCWLQVDDVVLDDELDRVAAYTPILVL